jgi:hypothetical protein
MADRDAGLTRPRRWRLGLVGLGVAVLLGHSLLLGWLGEQLAPQAAPGIERMEALYTRMVTPTAPPAGPAAPARAPVRAKPPAPVARAAEPAASAASAVADAASAPDAAPPEITVTAASDAPMPPPAHDPSAAPGSVAGAPPDMTPSASAAAPPAVAEAPAAAASGPAFTWPSSTRLQYTLLGWYQGEVRGSAQVEWLRAGDRYQVHLDVIVGPSLAPLVARRMSSEGRITPAGLRPLRYEQETRQLIGRTRQVQLGFDDDAVRLPDGRRMAARADVQDTASQFIQMVFLFSTRPELRRTGQRVEFDLALPHRVRRWVYEVGEFVPVATPLGELETFHVRPTPITTALPEAGAEAVRSGGSILSAQIWYAPTLQMLPVRIRIEQDPQTWVDLTLSEVPQQARP